MLSRSGQKLVMAEGQAPYMETDGRRLTLINKSLGDREWLVIRQEAVTLFSDGPSLSLEGQNVRLELGEKELSVSLDNATTLPESVEVEFELERNDALNEPGQPAAETQGPLGVISLLSTMGALRASDLHLSTDCPPIMRIDGEMRPLTDRGVWRHQELLAQLLSITPPHYQREFEETHDTDFAYPLEGHGRFRANIFLDQRGVGAVFRRIPADILSTETLQVPSSVVKLCSLPKGLILVTGPTGSGKSTTLASLIDHINRTQRKHIITVEGPVEFVHANRLSLINQREVHNHTQSFKRALRAALREDPDIILVGEMRDLETIAIAIEMAVTGHLVFGTLHTSTAIGTVDRIIDQFPPEQQNQIRTMLADSLKGVVAQTLVKKKTGGRLGGYEVMLVTPAISNLIREGKTYQIATLMQTGKAQGMQMLNTHLTEMVARGEVEAQEALSRTVDRDGLALQLKGRGLLTEDPPPATP